MPKKNERSVAKAAGLSQYFTGKPCTKGHISARSVSNAGCLECHRLRYSIYRSKNLKEIRERNRLFQSKYQKENPEVKRKAQSLRRARLRNAPGSFTTLEIKELLIRQDHKCAICKSDLVEYHIDHMTPLSRDGDNWITNIQLLCPNDNRRKNAKTDIEYRQKLGLAA